MVGAATDTTGHRNNLVSRVWPDSPPLSVRDTILSRIYKCREHGVWLVPRVRTIRLRGGRIAESDYFACPVAGCKTMKANKWSKNRVVCVNQEAIMALFVHPCPKCQSNEWKSVEKDENGINLAIQCLNCGTIRERRQQPMESIQ